MVTIEVNMSNLHNAEKRVTIGDSGKLTGEKLGVCIRYQKLDGKLHHVTLSNTYVIIGPYANVFRVTKALHKGFQVTSEGKALILNKIQPKSALTGR